MMRFSAHIIRSSSIDRLWRQHHRLGGEVAGVVFRLVGNLEAGRYVAETLTADEVAALKNHIAVRIEAITDPVGNAASAERPEEPAKPSSAAEPPTATQPKEPAAKGRSRPAKTRE